MIDGGKQQRQLLFKLFKEQGYNPLERPVENENESLEVVIGMALSVKFYNPISSIILKYKNKRINISTGPLNEKYNALLYSNFFYLSIANY
jgi:hypothetical protein